MTDKDHKLILFQSQQIRRVWHTGQWFFSVVDVVAVLVESADAGAYWRKLKQRLLAEGSDVVTFCHALKLEAGDGKKYRTDCAHTEGLLRIIQSIPSPKAEPFKRWLAQVGYERIEEIENPERMQERMKRVYQEKGYSPEWIEKRIRSIAIRQNLTDEWKERGMHGRDFGILTAEISRATFGMTPSEYRKHKDLPSTSKENLRDHMTDLELIFTMLGEKVTTEISQKEQPVGLPANHI